MQVPLKLLSLCYYQWSKARARAFEPDFLTKNIFFVSDMMELPDELYQCLKNMTSQEPSPVTLESYLPSIRDTILKLLQGLKLKQKTLRERFEPTPSPSTETPQKSPSPLNLKLPYQKRISVPQTPISPLSDYHQHQNQHHQGKKED